jgi:hypothetical protein
MIESDTWAGSWPPPPIYSPNPDDEFLTTDF